MLFVQAINITNPNQNPTLHLPVHSALAAPVAASLFVDEAVFVGGHLLRKDRNGQVLCLELPGARAAAAVWLLLVGISHSCNSHGIPVPAAQPVFEAVCPAYPAFSNAGAPPEDVVLETPVLALQVLCPGVDL